MECDDNSSTKRTASEDDSLDYEDKVSHHLSADSQNWSFYTLFYEDVYIIG